MIYKNPEYRVMGDRSLLVELGDEISPFVNRRVRALFLELDHRGIQGIQELVPSYRSLLVIYDPLVIPSSRLWEEIRVAYRELTHTPEPRFRTVRVPVAYGGEYGPDLEWVATYHGILQEDVIAFHIGETYQVYMFGFTPGYPYMGDLHEAIVTPRRETPRTSVPRGSVAIAQNQTGIYPVESPGGWHVIGRTPLELFDLKKNPPALLEMGALVEFYAISEEELARWKP